MTLGKQILEHLIANFMTWQYPVDNDPTNEVDLRMREIARVFPIRDGNLLPTIGSIAESIAYGLKRRGQRAFDVHEVTVKIAPIPSTWGPQFIFPADMPWLWVSAKLNGDTVVRNEND